jgi:hypothetical protein
VLPGLPSPRLFSVSLRSPQRQNSSQPDPVRDTGFWSAYPVDARGKSSTCKLFILTEIKQPFSGVCKIGRALLHGQRQRAFYRVVKHTDRQSDIDQKTFGGRLGGTLKQWFGGKCTKTSLTWRPSASMVIEELILDPDAEFSANPPHVIANRRTSLARQHRIQQLFGKLQQERCRIVS